VNASVPWLDQDRPHDDARDQAQRDGLVSLFGRRGVSVLDLGCGCGRTVIPLAERGTIVVGMDRDPSAIERCQRSCDEVRGGVDLRVHDMTEAWPALGGPFDAVLCLGNTWLTIVDLDVAMKVFDRALRVLKPTGVLILDDIAHDFFRELTEGNWQTGHSEDGVMQMVWAAAEPVFTIRTGAAIDPTSETLTARDTRYRLWTMDTLTLLARVTGFSDPQRRADAGLLVFATR